MEMGKTIKTLRLEKQVRQEEMAHCLGVSSQAVSKWETDSSLPDITLLPAIATYFGVTIDELFQRSNESRLEQIENMMQRDSRVKQEIFDQSVRFLKELLLDEPKNVRAYLDLAALYNHRALSGHRAASEYAKKALEMAPDEKAGKAAFLEANNSVCGDEWYDNHFEVIEYFREFLQKNPDNYNGLYAIIVNLLADGRFDEAVPYIENLQKIKDDYQAMIYLGDVALGQGGRERAIQLWNQAVAKSPDAWQVYCERADRLKELGMYEAAMADYEHCFTMQKPPRITDGLYSLAQMHEGRRNYKAAIADYRRIIQCIAEDHNPEPNAESERLEEEIKRLRKLAERMEILANAVLRFCCLNSLNDKCTPRFKRGCIFEYVWICSVCRQHGERSGIRLSFCQRQQHSRLALIFLKARLAGLPPVCQGDADKQEKERVGERTDPKIPLVRKDRDHRQRNAPPHQDLAKVIGVAGIPPQAVTYENSRSVLLKTVHLIIGDPLHQGRADRKAEEEDSSHVPRAIVQKNVSRGENTGVYDQRGHHMDAGKVDNGVEYTRLFLQHGIAPVLMRKALKGIGPVGGKPHAPENNGCQQKDTDHGQPFAYGKGREDHDGLYAPIRVVDRRVVKQHTERKGHHGRGGVRDEQIQPPVEGKQMINSDAGRSRKQVNQRDNEKARDSIVF